MNILSETIQGPTIDFLLIHSKLVEILDFTHLVQEDETDYYDRRSRNRFEDDLEVEARAEKRILNAKKVFGLLTSSTLLLFPT